MPEQIRLKVGGVTHQQIAVYEEFARNIPGFSLNTTAKPDQQQQAALAAAGAAAASYMNRMPPQVSDVTL